MYVFRLATGTVIDHIPPFRSLEVNDVLGLSKDPSIVLAIGVNLTSRKYGRKDVVKIENRYLSGDEINKLSLIAPSATVSVIEDNKILKKEQVRVPDVVEGLLACGNYNCITNAEPVTTVFSYSAKKGVMRCLYCERSFPLHELKLK